MMGHLSGFAWVNECRQVNLFGGHTCHVSDRFWADGMFKLAVNAEASNRFRSLAQSPSLVSILTRFLSHMMTDSPVFGSRLPHFLAPSLPVEDMFP